MLFNSFVFFVFFPICILGFFIIPKKIRQIWLLICSYIFCLSFNIETLIVVIAVTAIGYFCGLQIDKYKDKSIGKKYLILNIIFDLITLVFFKYCVNGISTLNEIISIVGISYYSLQSISYSIDLYNGICNVEKSYINYSLYISFFPHFVSGPIDRAKDLLPQIKTLNDINIYDGKRIKHGLIQMIYGYFEKLVIADRVAILVNEVFVSYQDYGFVEIAISAILFIIELYCDFDGYTNIALGAAKVVGLKLQTNFKQPFFAVSSTDFWRRWHISLTSFFKDYIYVPLKNALNNEYIRIVVVFTISALWHGLGTNFIVWGLLNALYVCLHHLLKKSNKSKMNKYMSIVHTFVIETFAFFIFRCDSLAQALLMIKQCTMQFVGTKLLRLLLSTTDYLILFIALIVLFVVDIKHEKNKCILGELENKKIVIRWFTYIFLIIMALLFGIYGTQYDVSNFIYTVF